MTERVACRFFPPVLGLTIFCICVTLYHFAPHFYFDVLYFYAVSNFFQKPYHPFLDLQFLFASAECLRKGIDVLVSNPCDPLGRRFNYSPLWLQAAFLFPSMSWINVYGVAIGVAFFGVLAFVPPARRTGELAFTTCAAISPPVTYAIERANADILMFMLIVFASALWTRGFACRIGAYALAMLAGLLKFYAFVALCLSTRERPKVFLTICVIFTAVVACFLLGYHNQLVLAVGNIPKGGYFGDQFGAANVPRGAATILLYMLPQTEATTSASKWLSIALWASLLAATAVQVVIISRWAELRRALRSASESEKSGMLFGAAIVSGCFFAGQNVGYRAIYLLIVLPGFLGLRRIAEDRRVERFFHFAAFLTLIVLWQGIVMWPRVAGSSTQIDMVSTLGAIVNGVLWMCREIAWWWLVAILVGLLIASATEGRHESAQRLWRAPPAVSKTFSTKRLR